MIGRPRNVETPDEMMKLFKAYKRKLIKDAKNWPKVQYVGKDGNRKTDYPKLPLTLCGFEVFCYDKKIGCVEQYFTNQDGGYVDFLGICAHIRKEIRQDQITGGLLGEYNPSITQRLNNLVDKQSTEIKGGIKLLNIDPLDD